MRHRETRDLLTAESKHGKRPTQVFDHFGPGDFAGRPLPRYESWPVCAAGVRDFGTLIRDAMNQKTPGAVDRIYQDEWECAEFIQWVPGLTPREHRALQEREESRRREDQRDQAQIAFLKAQHKWDLLVLGGAVIAATIFAALIQAAWIPKPF